MPPFIVPAKQFFTIVFILVGVSCFNVQLAYELHKADAKIAQLKGGK